VISSKRFKRSRVLPGARSLVRPDALRGIAGAAVGSARGTEGGASVAGGGDHSPIDEELAR